MNIRLKTLWRVPVFCLAAGWAAFYITIYMNWFYVVKTTGPDGVIDASIDPIRSTLLDVGLFVLVLLIGGLWLFRSMTKAEIAVSAAIAAALYLAVIIPELIVPNCFFNFSPSLSVTLMELQEWRTIISSFLWDLTNQIEISAVLSCFAPFLFVPFGKRAIRQGDPGLTVEA